MTAENTIKEIGRYVVEKKIGQGSMGEVYKARDNRIHRSVAVKTLRLDKLKTEEVRQQARNFFLQEARVYGKLNHSNIAAIFDMGIHDGSPYLVMEYIRGNNLKEIAAQGLEFPFQEKVRILATLARTLHYAHQHGVLHRDIKPANIMILKSGLPKITDFGIARIIDPQAEGTNLEAEDDQLEIIGTPHYMSPEHIRGKGYDARSDVFSLGIVAYELLSKQRPFSTEGAMKGLLKNILTKKEKSLLSIGAADKHLSRIIAKAMAKEPEKRFQTAEEFSDELEMYLNSLEMAETEIQPPLPAFDKSGIIKRLKEKYFFFADFSEDEISTIFKLAQKKSYIPGEFIIREGTVGTKMYVILTGAISIQNETDGQVIEIERLGAGCCVGEMSLIDKMERSASVVALEPTTAIAINETVLRLSNPKICLKLYRNLAAMVSEKLRIHDERYKNLMAASLQSVKWSEALQVKK